MYETRLSKNTNHIQPSLQARPLKNLHSQSIIHCLKAKFKTQRATLCPPLSTSVSIIVKKKVTILKNRQGNGPVRGSLTSFISSKSQVVEPRSFRVCLFNPGLRRNDTTSKILYVDHLLSFTYRPLEHPDFRSPENHRFIVATAAPRIFRVFFLRPGRESATISTEESP